MPCRAQHLLGASTWINTQHKMSRLGAQHVGSCPPGIANGICIHSFSKPTLPQRDRKPHPARHAEYASTAFEEHEILGQDRVLLASQTGYASTAFQDQLCSGGMKNLIRHRRWDMHPHFLRSTRFLHKIVSPRQRRWDMHPQLSKTLPTTEDGKPHPASQVRYASTVFADQFCGSGRGSPPCHR